MRGHGVLLLGINATAVVAGLIAMFVYPFTGLTPAEVGHWPLIALLGGLWGLYCGVAMVER